MACKFRFAACALVAIAVGGSARAAADGPVPHSDPSMGDGGLSAFYDWTKPVPGRPGQLLRVEPAPADRMLPHAAQVMRILYSSRSGVGSGGPVIVSGEILLPKGRPPAGGWPVVAWAHGTTGFADVCAPSWQGRDARDNDYLDTWLSRGFAIVATDYEGLGTPGDHPYLLWKSEAHSILDSARAVLRGGKYPVRNEIVLVGQSQGAGAALGAAWLAPAYAPDLHVKAAVLTGLVTGIATAKTHEKAESYSNPAKMAAGFAMLRFAGTDHALHPEADLNSYLTDKGKIVLQTALHGCIHDVFDKVKTMGIRDGGELFSRPIEPIDRDMEPNFTLPNGRITVPVFVGTGLADAAAGTGGQYDAVKAMCAAGSHVSWHTYPGLSHNGTVNGSLPDSGPFVADVLSGHMPATNCGSLVQPGPLQTPAKGVPFND